MKQPNAIIKYALDATVKLVNTNTDPTEALQKVAKSLDLSSDYIQRVGEALNVALHHHHFKTAEDKAADFPVANIPLVKKAVFGAVEKNDLKKKADHFSNNFEEAPIDYNKILHDRQYKQQYVKTASVKDEHVASDSVLLKRLFKQSQDYLSSIDKELDGLKTKRAFLTPRLEASYSALVRELNKAASAPFEEVESQVFAKHGQEALPYLDFVYKTAGLKSERGVHDDKYQFFTDSRATSLFGDLLKVSEEITATESKIKEAESLFQIQYNMYKDACAKLAGNEKGLEYTPATDLDPVMAHMRKKAELNKEAIGPAAGAGALGSMWGKFKELQQKSEPPSPVFQNSDNDNHERTHILQDLVMTDPLLVKEDPRKIIGAYEQFLRIAPHLSQQKEVVRAHLRAATTGQTAMSSFDAGQHMDANQKLMNQHKMLINDQRGGVPKTDNK